MKINLHPWLGVGLNKEESQHWGQMSGVENNHKARFKPIDYEKTWYLPQGNRSLKFPVSSQFLSLHSFVSCALSYPRLGLFLELGSQDEKHRTSTPVALGTQAKPSLSHSKYLEQEFKYLYLPKCTNHCKSLASGVRQTWFMSFLSDFVFPSSGKPHNLYFFSASFSSYAKWW